MPECMSKHEKDSIPRGKMPISCEDNTKQNSPQPKPINDPPGKQGEEPKEASVKPVLKILPKGVSLQPFISDMKSKENIKLTNKMFREEGEQPKTTEIPYIPVPTIKVNKPCKQN